MSSLFPLQKKSCRQSPLPFSSPYCHFTPPFLPSSFLPPGESRDKKDLVYVDSEGVQRASKPVGEALQERRREGVHAGKVGKRGCGLEWGLRRWHWHAAACEGKRGCNDVTASEPKGLRSRRSESAGGGSG
jgi:hypothetical protein